MSKIERNRILDLLGIELPIIQAPMAGATTPEMVIATSEAGGLGSLPAAMLSAEQARAAMDRIRAATARPINLNFFTHVPEPLSEAQIDRWRAVLAPYYAELGLDASAPMPTSNRAPFDDGF